MVMVNPIERPRILMKENVLSALILRQDILMKFLSIDDFIKDLIDFLNHGFSYFESVIHFRIAFVLNSGFSES